MSNTVLTIITALIAGLCGSGVTGLLQFFVERNDKKKAQDDERLTHMSQALKGLCFYEIEAVCKDYLSKGSITMMEYNALHQQLYAPYQALGGNGQATKLMTEIDKLPFMAEGE